MGFLFKGLLGGYDYSLYWMLLRNVDVACSLFLGLREQALSVEPHLNGNADFEELFGVVSPK